MMIELTDEQAMVFRLLSELGAWDIVNGSVTVHYSQRIPIKGEKREVVNAKLSTPPKDVHLVKIVV